MERDAVVDMKDFELGMPSLVCRWRIYRRHLPLANRHLRSLLAREAQGRPVTKELVAWAKQHIEWTLEEGSAEHPNGVLMLMLDTQGRAAMTVGPFEPLADTRLDHLLHRAEKAQQEAARTHVAPETLWVARNDTLLWDPGDRCVPSGSASLVAQLAQTMGLRVQTYQGLLDGVATGAVVYDEAFFVSDEYGIVPVAERSGSHGVRMAQGYQRLIEHA